MIKISDIKGINKLVTDSVSGVTDIVSTMHKTIDNTPGLCGATTSGPIGKISDIVYNSIHSVNNLVRDCIDTILSELEPIIDNEKNFPERDAVLSALNGVLGDYLVKHNNPLAIPMTVQQYKQPPLNLETLSEKLDIPDYTGKLLVVVHGLCMNYQQWLFNGHNHADALARDFGYTPLYLNYNTGLHISINGRSFSNLLELLIPNLDIKDFVIFTHSMGGLVTRSAYHYGIQTGCSWPKYLNKQFFLGTPHHGAPLEKGGNWINLILERFPHAAPFARLAKIRSSGITDLRYGTILDEDWISKDRFDHLPDERHPVPLPEKVQSYAIAGTLASDQGNMTDKIIGDGLVPTDSALGKHSTSELCLQFPEDSQWIAYGLNHWDLLYHETIYEKIYQWCSSNGRPYTRSRA
ncbi:MAG: PGAP1-like protein [Candidatus Magnetoglobus multicellularis str. Araruama]|uniref:PGAP1-like protein n=1 Tax=Candidatus Magnetoglobus multicellularis str. Araruama TaxID=890399 RepID=A0A1V1PAJ3_9BACT|nr:MAG: PGAP1-like protein [Candidatus Magnetoglobus multicellularis str. Araruama]